MALISVIRDLHRRKARERRGLALAEGVRLVEEMVATGTPCKGAAVAPSLDTTPRGAALRAALMKAHIPVETLSDDDLRDVAATEHPQGVVAVYEPRQWPLPALTPAAQHPLVILDAVQDPGNVGTIARTALAFGASGLIALPGTADLTNPKTVRAAMGALFRLPHMHAADDAVFDALSGAGIAVWATAMDGESIDTLPVSVPVALIVGNEGAGIRPDLLARATKRVAIPIRAEAESLNVAVAAGILLHRMTIVDAR